MNYLPYSLEPGELEAMTSKWKGERFADGRPRVADEILATLKDHVSITHAWSVCKSRGYEYQTLSGFQSTKPSKTLIGRAMTAVYLPIRPDMREWMMDAGHEAGEEGDMVSWPIMRLTRGDVYVADVFGKLQDGPVIGDRLASAVFARSANGCVHNAAIRDIDGIRKLEDFVVLHKGMHPSHGSPHSIMLAGINCPARIETVTVLPGDVCLAKDDTVIFIPPHLAEYCALSGLVTEYRDAFGIEGVRAGRYTPGQIDAQWTAPMEEAFLKWLRVQPDVPFQEEDLKRLGDERLW